MNRTKQTKSSFSQEGDDHNKDPQQSISALLDLVVKMPEKGL